MTYGLKQQKSGKFAKFGLGVGNRVGNLKKRCKKWVSILC
jgi:hypothetical protein